MNHSEINFCILILHFTLLFLLLKFNLHVILGEVERLLREYQQNQELVENIRSHYYQIIYPVQLRHHEKMGISTREAGIPKVIFLFILKNKVFLQNGKKYLKIVSSFLWNFFCILIQWSA